VGRRIKILLLVALAALVMRACVVEPVRLTDDSMAPYLSEGDVAFVFKLSYGLRVPGSGALLWKWASPHQGDVVVAVNVGDPPVSVMRRISAGPGDVVSWEEGKNVTLKPDEYFLKAEKAEGSVDSQRFGPVPLRSIIGRVSYTWASKNPSKEGGSKVESEKPRETQPPL
jgi:signal peptidase I